MCIFVCTYYIYMHIYTYEFSYINTYTISDNVLKTLQNLKNTTLRYAEMIIIFLVSQFVLANKIKHQALCPHTVTESSVTLSEVYARYSVQFCSKPAVTVSVQFSSATQSCPSLCDPMNCWTPGLPVHHQLPESTQTHVH